MDIYHYDHSTGEFLEAGLADADPLDEGNCLVPAHATTTAPPAVQAGKARVWNGADWTHIADHRGETWWDGDGKAIVIDVLGNPAAQGLSDLEPPPPPPSFDDINAARAHRLAQGVTVSVTGYPPPIHVQCTDADCHNLRGLHQTAKNRVAAGDATTITAFRCAANAMHDLTPPQMEELCRKTFAYRDDLLAASWALKDTDPIPADYATNDAHWPASDQSA